ncbi:MAG: GTP cyclohydrolase I FolE2 [Treponema sp.]|nr:GTP cyclohydrolase I FolE2 [Treponema sp.]MBR0101781.1 GTP cyclohydrolase I FolE2 [Treponema sp.]MBR0495712.1 GTP cyclohydrolase I FolE2 [Treponema sp.]
MEYTCSYEGEVTVRSEQLAVSKGEGGSLPLAPIPLTTPEKSEQALPSPLRSGISATPSAGSNAARNARFFISIKVPIATLCPCSKAISEYGAHNQRGFVKVKVLYSKFFWIEDVISMIEECASTPLYSVLKRQDEKFVTEHAYDNPRFVEDVVREVYLGLKKMDFKWFTVEAETEESIHYHNAYAYAEYGE